MQKAFTLIELIVVFSVIGILTGLSIVSYSSYSNSRSFTTAVADVASMLNTAKSKALSQVKPTQCTGKTLIGYEVVLNAATSVYQLQVLCDTTASVIVGQTLPSNVTFANSSATTTLFNVTTATVANQKTITINGYGKTKKITVTSIGGISVN